ncbi:MbeD family mobilization/exclusion protein [Aeromonas sp. EERV15]|jgi:septal ring factor EnvC (AmiA/AmiB activator)|uniref:MbeD family mobilization/exclusion protein n=1 Tax=Aeromonas sp. EERV15 TaxID=1833892 RepID=UPI00083ABAA3|nr:MbeD family mobilization/exclusion protein [Aeromonas sp. EERV15]
MTELEQHLLSALEALQSEREQQQKEWQKAYAALQGMFDNTKQSNKSLAEQVKNLAEQVSDLAEQLSKLKG